MRFDEFVTAHGITVCPVDRFDGFAVHMQVPAGWELYDSAIGARVWVWRTEPRTSSFCANAVLTTHRVDAALDVGEVFAMLAEQQLQSVTGGQELHRNLALATEDPGVAGTLAMRIGHELGTIDSVSRSRIITTAQHTLIAQLTVTALHDSPLDRANIWLSVRPDETAGPASAGSHGGFPTARTRDGR
jgi:hypothetical protein